MNYADFFDKYVQLNIDDWREKLLSLNRAMNAAVSLFHAADYFHHSYPHYCLAEHDAKTLGEFVDSLPTAFQILKDVCNAHKHCVLTRGDPAVSTYSQTSVSQMGFGEARYGSGKYGSPEEVVVEDDSGQRYHFGALVNEVETMWRALHDETFG